MADNGFCKSGFGKSARLLTSTDFQRVFDRAEIKVSCAEILMLARSSDRDQPRVGLVVAKKNVRRAVQRNRFKRLVRETFRHNQAGLVGLDIIVLARRGVDRLDNPTLGRQLQQLWHQLQRRSQRLKREPAPPCSPES